VLVIRKVDGRLMQRANRAMVLELVRNDPALSRAAIVRRTGLSPATVSGIIDHLLREGFIREEGAEVTGLVGRRPLRLAFNSDARYALGIDVDVDAVSAALVDLGGRPGKVYRATVPAGTSPTQVLDLAAAIARQAIQDAPAKMVLGVGMAIPGMVQWPQGINLFSPNYGWRNVPVRALMEERLGRPVLADNEVRAVALAEHRFGVARQARTVVFLDVGMGVGGAVILDGSLYRGVHGAAGEMGHNTVEPNGPLCGCGNRGCLEVFCSVRGLVARVVDALALGRSSVLADVPTQELTVAHLARAAAAGDDLARELLARAATFLGLAVANAVDNWDPELVVLSGPVIREGADLFEQLLAEEQRTVLETGRVGVRVTRAVLDEHAKIIGAATLVIAESLAAPFPG
jgi:predicted NBD/HSP70 family sugar kinase